jgi:CheY-like chemotaxis protein
MDEHSILIVDSDQKNLKVLDATFSEASFITATAKSDKEALAILDHGSFNIVLSDLNTPSIDGYQLLKEIQRNPSKGGRNVIFISIKSDVWNRVKSLKLGAKDYIVKPIHASEVLARVNMLIQRLQRNEKSLSSANSQFSGRLEDLAIIDLIEILGSEKKTGILTVHNENGHSGQIVCSQGQVVSASTQALRCEEAIYKMMHWNRGRFSMLFTDVLMEDEFTISNMGLLLQGAKRMDLRSELLKQLPSLDAVVITTSNFKKITSQKEMNSELKEFLTLFDGERTLGRIVDDSHENEIVTFKRMVKLYKLGFLYVLRNFSKDNPLQFRSEEEEDRPDYVPFEITEEFEEKALKVEAGLGDTAEKLMPSINENTADFDLDEEDLSFNPSEDAMIDMKANLDDDENDVPEKSASEATNTAKNIIVIATKSSDLELFIKNVAEDIDDREKTLGDANILFSVLKLRGGEKVNVLGITPDEAITESMLYFSELTIGCLLLIDVRSANWSYLRYLYKTLHKKLSMPIVMVCNQDAENFDSSTKNISQQLDLDENTPLRFITEIDDNNVRRTLFTLLRSTTSEDELKSKRESFVTK